MTDETDEMLEERGKTYGDFVGQAMITQRFKNIIHAYGTGKLSDTQLEALDMVSTKIARILNGDPNHKDNWDDIAGYARLVAQWCRMPTIQIGVADPAPIHAQRAGVPGQYAGALGGLNDRLVPRHASRIMTDEEFKALEQELMNGGNAKT